MNNEAKVSSYQKIYNHLKQNPKLSDFNYPKEKEHLDFSFKAGAGTVFYRLFSNRDMLSLRYEATREASNEQLSEDAMRYSNNFPGLYGTGYDNKLVLQISIPVTGMSDQEAEKILFDKTNLFVEYILDKIVPEDMVSSQEETNINKEETQQVGFNTINPAESEMRDMDIAADNKKDEEQNAMETEDEHPDEPYQATSDRANSFEDDSAGYDVENEDSSEDCKEKNEFDDEIHKSDVEDAMEDDESYDSENPEYEDEEDDKYSDEVESASEEPIASETKDESNQQDHTESPEPPEEAVEIQENESNEEEPMAFIEKAVDSEPVHTSVLPEEIQLMYQDINKTFAMRSEQLDYREKVLTEQKELIALEKEALERQKTEAKELLDSADKQREDIQSKWNVYHENKKKLSSKLQAVKDRENRLEERENKIEKKESEFNKKEEELNSKREALLSKEQALSQKLTDYQSGMEKLKESEKNFPLRETRLELKEKQLEEKEQAIQKKMQDLHEMSEILDAKEEVLSKSKTVSEKEYNKILEDLKHAKESLNKSRDEKEMLVDKNTSLQNKISETQNKVAELLNEISNLRLKNTSCEEELRKEKKKAEEALENASSDNDAELEQVKAQKKLLQKKLDELTVKSESDQSERNAMKKEIDELKKERILPAEEQLNAMKVDYKLTPRDGGDLISGTLDNCSFTIDDKLHILYIEKDVRKNHTKTMMEWNNRSLAESYAVSGRKVIGKAVYANDLAVKLNSITEKFKNLK